MNVSVAAETDTPTITSFPIGTQESLGLETEHNDTKWYLIVKKAQDYEITAQRQYRFTGIAGSSSFVVSLIIINVDDVSPLFALQNSTTCEIKVSNALNRAKNSSVRLPSEGK